MKSKKNTVIVSALISLLSALCYAFVQFRLYHWFNLYSNGDPVLSDWKEFVLVISSGLFTGAVATLLISWREYMDEREAALRNLLRLANAVEQKYQNINFFTTNIPEKLLAEYMRLDYFNQKEKEKYADDELAALFYSVSEDGIPSWYTDDNIKTRHDFRETVWKHQSELLKDLYNTEEKKKKYLDKRCEEIVQEYWEQIRAFSTSLMTFADYDENSVQEAFDQICFFAGNKKKVELFGVLLDPLVVTPKFIKFYIRLLAKPDKDDSTMLYAYEALSQKIWVYAPEREYAVVKPSYQIAIGKWMISSVRDAKKKKLPLPKQESFKISDIPDMDFGKEIIYDSWEW